MSLTTVYAPAFLHAPWLEALKLCPNARQHGEDWCIDTDDECFRAITSMQLKKSARGTPGKAGTHLNQILHSLGMRACQGCNSTAKMMNEYGDAWCIEHRAKLVENLQRRMTQLQPHYIASAAMRAIAKGMTFVNPLDPAGSIFDESLRRSQINSERLCGV